MDVSFFITSGMYFGSIYTVKISQSNNIFNKIWGKEKQKKKKNKQESGSHTLPTVKVGCLQKLRLDEFINSDCSGGPLKS